MGASKTWNLMNHIFERVWNGLKESGEERDGRKRKKGVMFKARRLGDLDRNTFCKKNGLHFLKQFEPFLP